MAAGNQRNRVFMDRNKFTPPIEQKIYEIDAPEPDAQKSILLLEDETEFAHMVKEYLESCEFQVTVVRDGVQGLKKVMERDFDVIVCDLLMPNLPGDMFYVGVERVRPHLANRFIFIAGLSDDEIVQRLRATGQIFDLSQEQKDYLQQRGVSQTVIDTLPTINADKKTGNPLRA